jgi:hypothetical protein
MTESYSAANNKKFNTFSITDNFDNSYLYVRTGKDKRTGKDRWFNIAKREVLAKDKSIPKGYAGIIPDAVPVHPEEVAYVVAQAEEYQERLARAEASLREWIDFRRAWLRKGKRKLPIQKKEVI